MIECNINIRKRIVVCNIINENSWKFHFCFLHGVDDEREELYHPGIEM